MDTIHVLGSYNIIQKGDWVRLVHQKGPQDGWLRAEDAIPFWVGKELGRMNDAIGLLNTVIRCRELPYGFIQGNDAFKGVQSS